MTRAFRLLFWLAVAVTLFVTLRPLTVTAPGSDKTQHLITFAMLTLLAASAYPRARLFPLAAALSGLGAAVEVAQPFFGRGREFHDWIADTIGILIALALILPARRFATRTLA